MRPLAMLLLVALPALSGCLGNDFEAVLVIDFGQQRRPIDVEVRVDPDERPTLERYTKDGASHPDFYTAFDLLEDGRAYAIYTYNVTYYPTFGDYLLDHVNHVPGTGSSQFWLLSVNGQNVTTGIGTTPVEDGDEVRLTLTTFDANATL